MPPHPLTSFEIQSYYQNKPKFNSVYSGNNLPKIKDGASVINFGKYKSIRNYWMTLYVNGDNDIPKEIKKFIGNKNITTDIYRKQACN